MGAPEVLARSSAGTENLEDSMRPLSSPDRSVAGVNRVQDSRCHGATLEKFEKNLKASPGFGMKKNQLPLPTLGDGCYFIPKQIPHKVRGHLS